MKKICFIICTNDELLMAECEKYISRLYIMDDYQVEIITIDDAQSMAEGYNRAMLATNADYKIYLHQDLFIINRYFLINIIKIFESDNNISMIGMVGTQSLPSNAVMWNSNRVGRLCLNKNDDTVDERISDISLYEAVAVDGAIIATSKDVYWKEDVFDGFDFYDVSAGFEHRRRGYRVVIPKQGVSWCIHHDGSIINLLNYEKYRIRFIKNYLIEEFSLNNTCKLIDDSTIEPSQVDDYVKELKDIYINRYEIIENSDVLYERLNENLFNNDLDCFIETGKDIINNYIKKGIRLSGEFEKILCIISGLIYEKSLEKKTFIDNVTSLIQLKKKYEVLGILLRRIEVSPNDSWTMETYEYIDNNDISAFTIAELVYSNFALYARRKMILERIGYYYYLKGNTDKYIRFIGVEEKYEDR